MPCIKDKNIIVYLHSAWYTKIQFTNQELTRYSCSPLCSSMIIFHQGNCFLQTSFILFKNSCLKIIKSLMFMLQRVRDLRVVRWTLYNVWNSAGDQWTPCRMCRAMTASDDPWEAGEEEQQLLWSWYTGKQVNIVTLHHSNNYSNF